MNNHPNRSKPFKLSVPRGLVAECLDHFGPDPVSRGWCVEAIKQKGRWLFVEVIDENKEPKGSNLRRHVLTDEKIVDGLNIAAIGYSWVIGALLDADKHDAALADILVQCCIFGEEKYA